MILLVLKCSILLGITTIVLSATVPFPKPSYENPTHWKKLAQNDLKEAKQVYDSAMRYRTKNAILFLGDGFGITSVTASRILKGQMKGSSGEETLMTFEKFPYSGLIKTYNTNQQTPDSAATSTAFLSGVKAMAGTIGVNENAVSGNCSLYNSVQHDVKSFLTMAKEAGKSIGVVTTTRITHATPAGAYSHTINRFWEDDTDRNKLVKDDAERSKCTDIASQILQDEALDINVLMGGGALKLLPSNTTVKDNLSGKLLNGTRTDGIDIIQQWQNKQLQKSRKYKVINSLESLKSLDSTNIDYLLGIFSPSHLMFHALNTMANPVTKEPTLTEMVEAAIKMLSKNSNGFVLYVEGGRIDHGHHDNRAHLALHEAVAFDEAISKAGNITNEKDTLTVVTADHGHVFSIGGWGTRGNPILGKGLFSYWNRYNKDGEALAEDMKPYTVLLYGDGPGAEKNTSRRDLTGIDTADFRQRTQALVPADLESHGAEDVPLYAKGPGSYLFHRTHEQSYIAHVFMHSLCIGEYAQKNDCLPEFKSSLPTTISSRMTLLIPLLFVIYTHTNIAFL